VPLDPNLNAFVNPNLEEYVQLVESQLFPFKVSQPRSVTYHSWTYQSTDSQAQVVQGAKGWYLSLQTSTEGAVQQQPQTQSESDPRQ
jgi:hypothetical protein